MKRHLAKIGCYSVLALVLLGSVTSLATSSGGRIILGVILGIIGLFVIVCIPHNLRIWRARKVFRSLPNEVREQVLDLIEEAAAQNPSVTYMLLDESPCSEPVAVVSSYVGGVPYSEKGETSVDGNSDPPRF